MLLFCSAYFELVVLGALSAVEVNTVDKYQGRDKPVILLSFVKSKESAVEEKVSSGSNKPFCRI